MFHLLLSRHYPLRDALQLMTLLAPGASVRSELKEWGARLALGATRFDQMAQGGRVFPPLFVWLVSSAGEDLSEGFGRAASIYYSRAHHKIEMALYVLLPICTLTLGLLVLGQTYPVLTMIGRQVGMLGS